MVPFCGVFNVWLMLLKYIAYYAAMGFLVVCAHRFVFMVFVGFLWCCLVNGLD